MAVDIAKLWDFNDPALSEQRFSAALESASESEALLLTTQIARTWGIRGDFARARQILAGMADRMQDASPEAQVRFHLELGRTYASGTHPPEALTLEAKEQARSAYLRAFELAQAAELDSLAIDALHMLAFVDTAPEEQVDWGRKALAHMQSSVQPEAWEWESSLRNNVGYALHQCGRYAEALEELQLALAACERGGDAQTIRVAHWMIAWTLRAQERLAEALEIQLRLEKECDEAGEPDPYVFEELELLYTALGNPEKAAHYAERRKAA